MGYYMSSSSSDNKIGFFIPLAQIIYIASRAQQNQSLKNQIDELNKRIESASISLLRGWVYTDRPRDLENVEKEYKECLGRGMTSGDDSPWIKISNTGNTCHRIAGALLMISEKNFGEFLNAFEGVMKSIESQGSSQQPPQQAWELVPVVVDVIPSYEYRSAVLLRRFLDTPSFNNVGDLLKRLKENLESMRRIEIKIPGKVLNIVGSAGPSKISEALKNISESKSSVIEHCLPMHQRQGSQS